MELGRFDEIERTKIKKPIAYAFEPVRANRHLVLWSRTTAAEVKEPESQHIAVVNLATWSISCEIAVFTTHLIFQFYPSLCL